MTYTNIFQPLSLIALTLFVGFMIGLVVMFIAVKEECRELNKKDNKFLSDDV